MADPAPYRNKRHVWYSPIIERAEKVWQFHIIERKFPIKFVGGLVVKDQLIVRGKIFACVPEFLGIVTDYRREKFIQLMAGELHISGRTIQSWSAPDRKMPDSESYSLENLWNAITVAVAKYTAEKSTPPDQRERVVLKWKERGPFIRALLETAFADVYQTDQSGVDRVLSQMGESAASLPPLFAYKLFKDFDGYCTITDRDLPMLARLLGGSAHERRELCERIAAAETRPTGEIIGVLMGRDMGHWREIRNSDYKKNFENGKNPSSASWEGFTEKARGLRFDKLVVLLNFVTLAWPDETGASCFGTAEIDLFLQYKYCLTEDGRGAVLDWLKARTEKGPGQ